MQFGLEPFLTKVELESLVKGTATKAERVKLIPQPPAPFVYAVVKPAYPLPPELTLPQARIEELISAGGAFLGLCFVIPSLCVCVSPPHAPHLPIPWPLSLPLTY
jgi:hypothetical protein